MSSHDWRSEYRAATEAPHPAARERVWRAMQAPRRPRATLVLALAGCAAAAAVALVLWPREESLEVQHEGFAYVSSSARLEREGATLTLRSGRLVVSAWQTPVTVKAGARTVVVDSAIAALEVAGEQVSITPVEGVLVIDGERRVARGGVGSADVERLRSLESADAPVLRADADAERATVEQRWDDASRALSVVAGSRSLKAEAALLKRGELELRHQKQPARALSSFDEGDARFPGGTLGPERALSALEATVALAQWPEAVRRADAFLSRFPWSERADEVRAVKASALHAQGLLEEACALAASLSRPPSFAANCAK
ncbi:MAG: hypothetical protein JNJ54_29880 [Myxococcaceae bacterium]|nr:hypothetical protein [Myxococcaceae bacterium]